MQSKTFLLAAGFLSAIVSNSAAQNPATGAPTEITGNHGDFQLSWRRQADGVQLNWLGSWRKPDGSTSRPYFEVQRSLDLQCWQPVGERQRIVTDTTDQVLGVRLGAEEPHAFYRLLGVEPLNVAKLGQGGAEVFGYSDAFAQELQRIGQIAPDQFASMFPTTANYLPTLSWDPTTAKFWDLFNADLDKVNAGKEVGGRGFRYLDTRLEAPELAAFKKNGFVVSERLGSYAFGNLFYRIWKDDLPVFISTDALLQAWHRTFDAMLEEVEETYLFNSVQTTLDGMAAGILAASNEVGGGALKVSLQDADYYLAVARSLLAGTNHPLVSPLLGQNIRAEKTLGDIRAEQLKQVDDFMGFCRIVDFSQFKVRGHYTHTERLERYFQCMMWLGRIDMPVAGGPWKRCPGDERMASPRELGMAIVLWDLLNRSGHFEAWADMERTIQTFVGITDSLTFGQLSGLLVGAGINTLDDVRDRATLEQLQGDFVQGKLGVQNIRSDWFEQPLGGAARYALPQTFTVFGQKFVPDSWAFSQTVFSSILWTENGLTNKVQRRVPSALDVAFATLGNDQVVPELVEQMKGTFRDSDRPHALRFRDGMPYQHNLAAVRHVMDLQRPEAWESNLYMQWLAALRALSAPTTAPSFPEAMRTRAWAMKTLNTQLASWTQLRHDTILYAKQSYTEWGQCVYPTGFVEPRIEFWRRLRQMAAKAADLLGALKYEGTYDVITGDPPNRDPDTGEITNPGSLQTNTIQLLTIRDRQVAHLRNFATTVARLESLVNKELGQEAFNADDEEFLDTLMEEKAVQNQQVHAQPQQQSMRARNTAVGLDSGGPMAFTGWYPRLFYRTVYWTDIDFNDAYGSDVPDGLVADVHTDVPKDTPPDPGSVLHEGSGPVNLLMLAVNNGSDRFICAGPVLSHYEFEVIGSPRRISDQEWSGQVLSPPGILQNNFPPDLEASRVEGLTPPVWTRSYLVPVPRE